MEKVSVTGGEVEDPTSKMRESQECQATSAAGLKSVQSKNPRRFVSFVFHKILWYVLMASQLENKTANGFKVDI